MVLIATSSLAASSKLLVVADSAFHHKQEATEASYPVRISLNGHSSFDMLYSDAVFNHASIASAAGPPDDVDATRVEFRMVDGVKRNSSDFDKTFRDFSDGVDFYRRHETGGAQSAPSMSTPEFIKVEFELRDLRSRGSSVTLPKSFSLNGEYVGQIEIGTSESAVVHVNSDEFLSMVRGRVRMNHYRKIESATMGGASCLSIL
jgi:hypothetical protein